MLLLATEAILVVFLLALSVRSAAALTVLAPREGLLRLVLVELRVDAYVKEVCFVGADVAGGLLTL